MELPLLKPDLYASSAGSAPVLKGGRCHCGHVFFPMQRYGCESCGAWGEDLVPADLSGQGVLLYSAAVHIFRDEGYRVPFTVGSIQLDAGPVVRALVAGQALRPGQRVVAELAPTGEDEDRHLDLRFAPQSQ